MCTIKDKRGRINFGYSERLSLSLRDKTETKSVIVRLWTEVYFPA